MYLERVFRQSACLHTPPLVARIELQHLAWSIKLMPPCVLLEELRYNPLMKRLFSLHFDQPFLSKLFPQSASKHFGGFAILSQFTLVANTCEYIHGDGCMELFVFNQFSFGNCGRVR